MPLDNRLKLVFLLQLFLLANVSCATAIYNATNSSANGSTSNTTTLLPLVTINSTTTFPANEANITIAVPNSIYTTPLPNLTRTQINVSVGIVDKILGSTSRTLRVLILVHGYSALFVLMTLEGASVPIPSEIVIPLAGYFTRLGYLNGGLAFFAVLLGSAVGLAIDYYLGYYLGRQFFYEHLRIFRIKKRDLEAFDEWFDRHGAFAVFTSRLLPVVRSTMSFVAGFAGMDPLAYYLYSIAGLIIWDGILMAFGFYILATGDALLIGTAVGVGAIIFYYLSLKLNVMKRKKKRRGVLSEMLP